MLKTIDFVIPVYQNEYTVFKTYNEIKKIFIDNDYDVKIIFINDSSRDNSLRELKKIKKIDPDNVLIINLAKNYGQINAIYSGYCHSNADYVVTIAADLQDPITIIRDAISKKNLDELIVFARRKRNDGFFQDRISNFFWKFIKNISGLNFPEGGFDTFIMSKELKEKVVSNFYKGLFLQGLLLTLHPNPTVYFYSRLKREFGKSSWTFLKKLSYFNSAIFQFSELPLTFLALVATSTFFITIIFIMIIFYLHFFTDNPVRGWMSLATILSIGLSLLSLAIWIFSKYVQKINNINSKLPLFTQDEKK